MRRAAALCVTWRVCLQCMGPAGTGSGRFVDVCRRCRSAVQFCSLQPAGFLFRHRFIAHVGPGKGTVRTRRACAAAPARALRACNQACNHKLPQACKPWPAKGLLLLHSSAVSVGLCRDAPRGRPMCYEDEGALTSIEEVNVRACPRKGFSRNMSATSTLLSWALGGGRAASQPSPRVMTKTLVVWDFDWCACSAHSRHGATPFSYALSCVSTCAGRL